MRVGYVRCSTAEQNEARQMKMMDEQQVEKVFIDKASGKNTDREDFKAMMNFVRSGDTVIVESISRIARNTRDLLTIISTLTEKGVEYEVISGHRRIHACQKAGIDTVPALIYAMDREEAIISMVDSNLHRESILPSEKAFAYKLKMEAMRKQGYRSDLSSAQVVSKFRTNEEIGLASGESREQVRRYIRLTYLIPEILHMVDEKKIALTPAVEISYLTEDQQRNLLETMESEDCTPSLSQSRQMKEMSQSGQLDMDQIFAIMTQPKANQEEKLRFDMKEIRKYFPKSYTTPRIQKTILQLLEQ